MTPTGRLGMIAFWMLLSAQVQALQVSQRAAKPELDVRLSDSEGHAASTVTAPQLAAAGALRETIPGLELRWDARSGSPKWLAAPPGRTLSKPTRKSAESVARAYLRSNTALFGISDGEIDALRFTAVVPARAGGSHVYFTQTVAGLDVDGGKLNVHVDAEGAIRSVGSRVFGGLDVSEVPALAAADAVLRASRDVYPDRFLTGTIRTPPAADDAKQRTVFAEPELGRDPTAELVVFPIDARVRLAWKVRVAEPGLGTDYRILVDAADGRILVRNNMTRYAECRVLLAGTPDPETAEFEQAKHQLVTLPPSTPQSPQGWIAGAGTVLEGNNVVSHLGWPSQPGLASAAGVYDYPFNTNESALVNAWYWINDAHDRFYAAGFDEAAGNFQADNFGNGGIGGDPIQLVALPSNDPAYTSLAADGESPVVSFGWLRIGGFGVPGCRWCTDHDGFPENGGDRSAGFMREYMFHEYGHGVVNRRIGGPADIECLTGSHPRSLGGAFVGAFAASFFDDPAKQDYFTQGHAPTSDLRHDLTIATQASAAWGGALWDLRQSMIALDPAGGLDDYHQLLVEALAFTPCEPTHFDARDAILAADTSLFASIHHAAIWNVFAARGMGELATSVDENSPVTEDFTVPAAFACTPPAAAMGLVAVVQGTNAVRLDYDATGASSVEIRREDLSNPADAPERIDSTTDTSTYLDTTVQGGKSYRYHVVPLGNAGITCPGPASSTVDATATGTCDLEFPLFIPDVTFADGDPTCELTLDWTAAAEACPGSGEPIVYNIYRGNTPGFPPGDLTLVGRTTTTSYSEVPPEPIDPVFHNWFSNNWHYLVLAQHGTLEDPPDHRARGSAQVLQWRSAMPTLGRTTTHFWDFDSGPEGWTAFDWVGTTNPLFEWALVEPIGTHYGGALWAPDEAAGGSGMAWVTGDLGVSPDHVFSSVCSELYFIESPEWDATDGSTIVSFDYWSSRPSFGELSAALWIIVDGVNTRDIGMQTIQSFNGPGRYGWQRFELDITDLLATEGLSPSATQTIQFAGADCYNTEYGIDNVRVERATQCSRSDLVVQSVTVDDTPAGWGNGNGVLEPGEIATLQVELFNEGSAVAVLPTGEVRSPASSVAVLDGSASYASIAPATAATSSGDDFVVSIPHGVDCNGTIVFELIFTDGAGARATALWSPELGAIVTDTLFADDFESDLGWVASATGPFQGQWQRGDPVPTVDGSNPANPGDCADGPGTQCYVTGLNGGPASKDDVDPGVDPSLTSPPVSVVGYKRVHFEFDVWRYDSEDFNKNYVWWAAYDDDDFQFGSFANYNSPQSQWSTSDFTINASALAPTGNVRLTFVATDPEPEHILEGGIDNVVIEGERQECAPNSVKAPNAVGPTLFLSKSGADANLVWTAPSVDGSHDAAVFYEVFVSAAADTGFGVGPTPLTETSSRPLASATEFYVVGAVNAGGTSGEEP